MSSYSKTQPSVKASGDSRWAGLDSRLLGRFSGFWNAMADAERTLQTFVLKLAGWVNEEQRAVIGYSPVPSSNIGIRRVPKPARSTENDVSETPRTPASSPIHARLSSGTGRGVLLQLDPDV